MKSSDMRAKARAIFGPAFAEPMPKQPNGAKALQQRANARPIPTYKVGGPVKKPMPTPADRAAAKMQDEMLKKAKVTKRETDTLASANRSEGGYKKGGKVAKKAVGGQIAPTKGSEPTPKGPMLNPEVEARIAAAGRLGGLFGSSAGGAPLPKGPAPTPKGLQDDVNLSALADKIRSMSGTKDPALGPPAPVAPRMSVQDFNQQRQNLVAQRDQARRQGRDGNDIVKRMNDLTRNFSAQRNSSVRQGMNMEQRGPQQSQIAWTPETQGLRAGSLQPHTNPELVRMNPVQSQTAARLKKGGKVQTSSDTARKLAKEMGGMKKGGKPKDGLAVMIAIGKTKPIKKMNGGAMADRDMDMEAAKVTRAMGYAAGGAGKMRKGQAPMKKAEGGKIKKRESDDIVESRMARQTGNLRLGSSGLDLEAAARRGEMMRELDRMDMKPDTVRAPAKKQSFGEAFAEARRRGDKTFTWNGGTYGTKMKGEDEAPAPAPRAGTTAPPAPRPTAAAPASRAPLGVGMSSLRDTMAKGRRLGEEMGFSNAPSETRAAPARAAAKAEPRVGLQNARGAIEALSGLGRGVGRLIGSIDEQMATQRAGMSAQRKKELDALAEQKAALLRKGQTPVKKAQGGAGKVRKGMMTGKGKMLQPVKPKRGLGDTY